MNSCIFLGRLVRDPEIRYVMQGEKAVTKFAIAVDGFKKDDTLFLDCTAWDKRGEVINTSFKKGQRILVRGRLDIRSYEDKEGTKRKATSLTVDEFSFVEKKEQSGESAGSAAGGGFTGEDDEIPF